jgi:predicted transcriptional regulator
MFALACDMKANGINYREAERRIMEMADRNGTPRKEARATLKSAYKKDRTPARGNAALREWQRAEAFAKSYDWRSNFGRRALKRRAAYMACVERARMDGRIHWRATVREIAELMATDKKRAGEYLRELAEAGLIKRVSFDEGGIYRFVGLSELPTLYTTGSCSVVSLDTPKSQTEQDIFHKLGLVAWHVWRYLLRQPATTAGEIARATHLPRSSVYQALTKLQQIGFVVLAEGMYYGEQWTEASLEMLAASMFEGKSKSQARKELHQRERERRVNALVIRAMQRATR